MKLTLKALRVNAGLNQAEAAQQLGIYIATLRNYEGGKTSPGHRWLTNSARYIIAVLTT